MFMERTWTEYPRDIELETAIGTVKLAVTDANHVHVDGRVTVNRVEYNVSYHAFREHGWSRVQRHDLYLTRCDSLKDASAAARMKADVVLGSAVAKWADANADVLARAQAAHLNNELVKVDGELEKLQAQVSALLKQKFDLLDQLVEANRVL